MLTRREFVLLLAGLMALPAGTAFAKDGDDDNSGGGDDDDNSGSGGGHDGDDDDDDDNSGSGGGDDDNSGSGGDDDDNSGSGKRGEARTARDAVKRGKVIPLRDVLKLVRSKYPGRVIKVDVSEKGNSLIYSIKLIDEKNRRMQIRVNANQRKIIGAKFI